MNFVKMRKYWYLLSLLVIIPGLISFGIKGLNKGIDFTGGSLIELRFEQKVEVRDVRTVLKDAGLPQDSRVQEGEGNVIMIRTKDLSQKESKSLLQNMESKFGSYTMLQNRSVGPTVGKELRNKAILSLAIAFALMIVYITIRFELLSGLAAVSALVHDILVTVGLVSLFGLEVDGAFIAALLTIVGYSINATIVLFDRIRENMGKRKKSESLDELIHNSIMQTMARSINTVVAVALALVALLVFGGVTIKGFITILLIGVIAGCYSSIFISSPLWYDYRRLRGESIRTDA
ncbi:MAG TPA: protein translocase subunit SecF [Syntrophaceticus sp.]|jgi:preprotein translocase subunit SecF|uniref:protein translocase subunit SecF n=1 Tax=Syntrophaceticus schinkii TaxID=499207 RepID=UPI0005CC42BE|nr:protein translocase subunit SecF [Syntrophaceticus schinkii]HHY29283.1 protein translocase subunit SecF [Syntrophaceticus sp.]